MKTLILIFLILSTLITTISVNAQTEVNKKDVSRLADLAATGPRTDGGANFVWDDAKKKYVLLDLYLWERVTAFNPQIFTQKSPGLKKLKDFGDSNFYRFSTDIFAKRKDWFLVRDIDLSQYSQCMNSIKLMVRKRIAACQTKKFVFIDANMFAGADGLSQDGTILHEMGVGLAQEYGWYDNDDKKSEAEFRIQRFVGTAIHDKYTVESLKDFLSVITKMNYPTKAELESDVKVFERGRSAICNIFKMQAPGTITLITSRLEALEALSHDGSKSAYTIAHENLTQSKHTSYVSIPYELFNSVAFGKERNWGHTSLFEQKAKIFCTKSQ